MDEIDVSILKILQSDARKSLKEISGRVGLSLPATGERLRKMERSGLIRGYTALLDREKLGLDFCCFCLIILSRHESRHNEGFLAFVRGRPDILECHRITGSHEYLLKIVTKSPKTLESLLVALRDDWGVVKSSTYTVLSTTKEQPTAGPEAGG